MYDEIYKIISKKITINEINFINSNLKEKETYKKEIKRLEFLRCYILKKLILLKNYNETDIENFILWSM